MSTSRNRNLRGLIHDIILKRYDAEDEATRRSILLGVLSIALRHMTLKELTQWHMGIMMNDMPEVSAAIAAVEGER